MNCQNRVKLAFKIRGELIKAFEKKKKKSSIQVYQIITKSESNDLKNLEDGSIIHEELVEITEVDEDFNGSELETTEQVFVDDGEQMDKIEESEEADYLNESELITAEEEPLDAVSFLLEKKDLFKKDSSGFDKYNKRSHKCEVCEKSFMRKSNLVDHLRLHANVRLVNSINLKL